MARTPEALERDRVLCRLRSKKRNERKSEFLGMRYTSAQAKLYRHLLFAYVCNAGHNQCMRCGEPMTAENMSIDHIEPWFGVDVDLYWNLMNVKLSHKNCNSKYGRESGSSTPGQ